MTLPDCALEWITKLSIRHFTCLVLNRKLAYLYIARSMAFGSSWRAWLVGYGMLNSNI